MKCVAERGGAEFRERSLNTGSPLEQAAARQPVKSNDWVDDHVWRRPLVATDQELGARDYSLIRSMGAFDARVNLSGVHRHFVRMRKPEARTAPTGPIWRRYDDTGDRKVLDGRAGCGALQLANFPDVSLRHEEEIIGWMVTVLTMTSVQSIEVTHPPCMARNDAE